MKVWLLLLPLVFQACLCDRRPSSSILEMLKKEYPERRIKNIEKGDFEKWFVVGGSNYVADGNYRYAFLVDGLDFLKNSIRVIGFTDWDKPAHWPKKSADPLVFFFEKGDKTRYSGVMHELADDLDLKIWTLKGQRCQGRIPGWGNDLKYRAQSYVANGYLSYNPTDIIDLRPLTAKCLEYTDNQKLPMNGIKLEDADSSRLTTAMGVLHDKHCWTQKEEKCVDDQEGANTISVRRKNAILHVDDLTVYGHCCDAASNGRFGCDSGVPRCSYFIYDHLSGIDFYIDDELAIKMFDLRRVLFLVPAIDANDTFVKTRRNQFTTTTGASTTTTTTTTTLKPIDVATAPTRPPPVDPPIEDEAPIDEGPDDYEDDQFEADQQNPSSRSSQAFIIAIIFVWLTI